MQLQGLVGTLLATLMGGEGFTQQVGVGLYPGGLVLQQGPPDAGSGIVHDHFAALACQCLQGSDGVVHAAPEQFGGSLQRFPQALREQG